MLFGRIQGSPLGIPSVFVVEPGGSYNWFLSTSSKQFCRFSDPCDDNSTTREIQLRNIFVSGEKWHKPQSYRYYQIGAILKPRYHGHCGSTESVSINDECL